VVVSIHNWLCRLFCVDYRSHLVVLFTANVTVIVTGFDYGKASSQFLSFSVFILVGDSGGVVTNVDRWVIGILTVDRELSCAILIAENGAAKRLNIRRSFNLILESGIRRHARKVVNYTSTFFWVTHEIFY